MENQIINRDQAVAQGLKRFFTGIPCKHGHLSERATKSGDCVACNREKSQRFAHVNAKWREENRDRDLANKRKHYGSRKNEYIERNRAWAEANPEKMQESNRKWRRSEKGRKQGRDWYAANREKHLALTNAWKKENPEAVRAYTRGRQAAKIRATPSWVDLDEIKPFYAEAVRLERLDGVKRHVDHIVPLQGRNVCGLHVPWNLQILTETENCAKGNRHG